MDKLKQLITRHKIASLIALFFLIVFVGFSATSALRVAGERTQDSNQEQIQSAQGSSQAADDEQPEPDVTLSESQQDLIDGYDDATRQFIATLSASLYSADNGAHTLRFYDDYYIETENGNTSTHPYAISAIEHSNDGATTEIDTIVFETDTGTHIVTYSLVTNAESASSGQSTIQSSTMFTLKNTAYTRTDAVRQIAITGLNSEMTDLFGGDTDKLTTELSNWCSVHYPAATTATWDQNVTIDYSQGIVVTAFAIDNDGSGTIIGAAATVSVTYDRANGTFTFDL